MPQPSKSPFISAPPELLRRASWIWPCCGFYDLVNRYAVFRKRVTLAHNPKRALAWITADQSYVLWVNGVLVTRGPARGFHSSWPYDEVDLAPFLHRGENVIAVRAFNPGRSCFTYRSEGFAGLLFAARLGRKVVVSDKSWRTRYQEGVRRDTVPYSMQLPGNQECIDLRTERPNWTQTGFNDCEWPMVEHVRAWNSPPYFRFEPRYVPQMSEGEPVVPKLIGKQSGQSKPGWLETRNLNTHRWEEGLGHETAPDLDSSGWIEIGASGEGGFQSFLFDLGKVRLGAPIIEYSKAEGGECVDLLLTEILEERRLCPLVDTENHCFVALACRAILDEGIDSHEFYHLLAGRYLVVTVRGTRAKMKIRLAFRPVGYPFEVKGRFCCEDPVLNQIWEACAHTQSICAMDAYVDTPWREQAQWWGDARVQSWNSFALSGDARLLRRGIHSIAQQTTPDGLTFGHAPTMAHNCVLPDFSLIWLITIWDYYWQTGSVEPFLTHRDRIDSILEYFRDASDGGEGLVRADSRYWLFLDWTDLPRTGRPALLSLWLVEALEKLGEVAAAAKQHTYKRQLKVWEKRLRAACSELLTPSGLVCDGLTQTGRRDSGTSVQSQTLAAMVGLEGFDRNRGIQDRLLPALREEKKVKSQPSSYWWVYPLRLLVREGYSSEVVDFIRKHWKPMAEFGSTWEGFTPRKGDWSFSHAWSAHPMVILNEAIVGVRQTGVAWKTAEFSPLLKYGECSSAIPTPKGVLKVDWRPDSRHGGVSLNLKVPQGMAVSASLPGIGSEEIEGAGSRNWRGLGK